MHIIHDLPGMLHTKHGFIHMLHQDICKYATCYLCEDISCLLCNAMVTTRRLKCSEQKDWLIERMENRQQASEQQRLAILRGLIDADAFERFLAAKFPASKVTVGAQILRFRTCIQN